MHRRAMILGAPLALAACAGRWSTDFEERMTPEFTRDWRYAGVTVTIPESLTVSEANRFAPNADIVWHGEPEGDRKAQVAAILSKGIGDGASRLNGSRPVAFSVTLQEFHAVTPVAVAQAPAAVHNISYYIQAFDAKTTQPVTEAEAIAADLPAYTGAAAIVAAQEGQTQKVRIINHLARVTESWLGMGDDIRRDFSGFGR